MENVAKYLLLLETLKFPKANSEDPKDSDAIRLEHNVNTLKKFVRQDVSAVLEEVHAKLQCTHPKDQPVEVSCADSKELYIVYMQHVLLTVVDNTSFDSDSREDLISTRHVNLCIDGLQDLAVYGLQRQLHPLFCKSGVFVGVQGNAAGSTNYPLLCTTINSFRRFLQIKQFHIANSMELVVRDYMAAIFSVLLANNLKEFDIAAVDMQQLKENLHFIWQRVTKMEYFRNVLLLKAIKELPPEMQKQLHQELLSKLMNKDGFTTFVATMQTAHRSREHQQLSDKQTFEVIANIVAFRGHSSRFQQIMLKQVFQFLKLCLHNEGMTDSMGVGLLTLRRLYDLNEQNRNSVKDLLQALLKELWQPTDLLSGLVLMEHTDFCLLVAMLYQLFCTSAVECLPSELLIDYLPMLLQMYYDIPDAFEPKQQISHLITRCLNNREPATELPRILQALYARNFAPPWRTLHERILIVPNVQQTELSLRIAAATHKQEFSISLALPELLMKAEHHILTYHIFMILLKCMSTILEENVATAIELLHTEEELMDFLNAKYPVKVELILSLNTLISHQPLRAQISENYGEFLKCLRFLIERRMENTAQSAEFADQTLLIMLTLVQETMEHAAVPDVCDGFIRSLQQLAEATPNQLVQQRIKSLVALLTGERSASAQPDASAFNEARNLIESHESHLQVYGIQMMLDLLRRKDAVTLSSAHVVIALALTTLRDTESYTFLNCVRLFVGLVSVHEAEVLEVLSDEYLNETSAMDYRLVVGEAILKVGQELGPLCYKYKDVLLNCFMHGARSPHDEFRMSAFCNLAAICRTLAYQVHRFFEELLHLIDCELSSGKYLPAKRAAVLVLSELLAGMDNLLDFEEMLLPLYRLLKVIEANEHCDAKMRVHAANGLKALADKCKSLLFPEAQLQKEIRILDIQEDTKKAHRAHILEIN